MSDIKTPWYPVPPCTGATGWEGDPHILNREGEPVGSFEMMADAEATARAVNERPDDISEQRREDEMRYQCAQLLRRLAESGRHYATLSEAYLPDVRAQEYQLHGIQLLCESFGWRDLAETAKAYSGELNSARARMSKGANHE